MTDSTKNNGVIFALLSTFLWGSYPIWYSHLSDIVASDVLAFRVIGSCISVLTLIIVLKSVSIVDVKQLLSKRNTVLVLLCSSIVTAIWWLTYIYAVGNNLVLEASLGYFISPIISVLFGFIIFKERPTLYQWFAILITFCAVAYLIFNYGKTPWVAIIIGCCFSLYAAIRRGKTIKALPGLCVECMFLLPFAVAFLNYQVINYGADYYSSVSLIEWLTLAFIGLISVLPLWWYTISAQNLKMITLSFFQLIPPICNFLFAVFLFDEVFTNTHIVTFCFIWLASIFYLADKVTVSISDTFYRGEKSE